MIRLTLGLSLLLASATTLAFDNCASSINELRNLIGDQETSMSWLEKASNPQKQLTLRITDSAGLIRLRLTSPRGEWALMSGEICHVEGTRYVANLKSDIVWGPASPSIIKGSKIRTVNLNLTSSKQLKVSVTKKVMLIPFTYNGDYSPL